MAGAAWFHWTGITPALGTGAAACVREAIDAARRAGARVSVDLNFRRKLWTEAQAQAVMRPLVAGADLIIANEEDLQSVLGIGVAGANVTSGRARSRAPIERRPDTVAQTSAPRASPSRCAKACRPATTAGARCCSTRRPDVSHHSQRYVMRVVDRIGGGDSFAAGLLYGLLQGWAARDARWHSPWRQAR